MKTFKLLSLVSCGILLQTLCSMSFAQASNASNNASATSGSSVIHPCASSSDDVGCLAITSAQSIKLDKGANNTVRVTLIGLRPNSFAITRKASTEPEVTSFDTHSYLQSWDRWVQDNKKSFSFLILGETDSGNVAAVVSGSGSVRIDGSKAIFENVLVTDKANFDKGGKDNVKGFLNAGLDKAVTIRNPQLLISNPRFAMSGESLKVANLVVPPFAQ